MTRFLRFLLVACILTASSPAFAAHVGKSIGAIRWDPWYIPGETDERPAVESSLGPAAWQPRAPSCASVLNTYTINFNTCGTQGQIDAEIAAAHTAGLDYWAYVWYGPADPMQAAWRFHQASATKANMNWALMYSSYALFVSTTAGSIATYTGYLQQANYQTVTVAATVRPLVYIISDTATSNATLAASITTFRAAVVAAGLNTPYVVVMTTAAGTTAATGADAVAAYASGASPSVAQAYSVLVTAVEALWVTIAATTQPMVPTAVTGWDRRPRNERPVPWEVPGQRPYIGDSLYFIAGTTSQIATHVGDMITWMTANTTACPSQTGLIYSWDEHDEGGSTLNPSLGTGSTILTAVGGAL